jgi:uncharacterized protein
VSNQNKVFLIHGFGGTPNGGWRSWLMGQLALIDIYACSLPMPTPDTPIKEEWVKEIEHGVGFPNENIFLVGHSLGVPAILQYLQNLPNGARVGGVVLVSGPYTNVPDEQHKILDGFFVPEYDFSKIKNVCKNFAVIHGEDDKVVPLSDAQKFAEALGCNAIAVPNGGHLNGSSGWRELPPALTALTKFF